MDPGRHRVHAALATFWLEPASRKPREALKHAREAIRLEPRWVGGHHALACAHAELEQWKELDAALLQAEKAVPDKLEPYYGAARTLFLKW